jgi:hypothetical protein
MHRVEQSSPLPATDGPRGPPFGCRTKPSSRCNTLRTKGDRIMLMRMMIGMALAAALLVVPPCIAQGTENAGPQACSPEGTWYGSNSLNQNYLFTLTPDGGGRYTAVAEDPTFCYEATAWRGELIRTGARRYWLRQILLCDSAVPGLPGLLLWAVEGEVVMTSCNHFEATLDSVGAYFWGTGAVPFVDPFHVPYPGVVTLAYDRMPHP